MLNWTAILEMSRNGSPAPPRRVEKTPAEWREVLSDEVFRVTRQAGTERPFASEMCSLFEPGIYACTCCAEPMFDASEKFDSRTGWPSFTRPIELNAVAYNADHSHGMTRVESVCAICDAHLGHVFPDGPGPTGLRYCINAVSLKKVADQL